MAQTDRLHSERGRRPAVDRHRVGVLDEQSVGAYCTDVGGDLPERTDGAQAAENSAGAARVAYGLVDTELAGHIDVVAVGLDPADLERADDKVRPRQRLAPVHGHSQLGAEPVDVDQALGPRRGDRHPALVNVVEADLTLLQRLEGQDVPDQGEREDVAAGSDDRDLGHLRTVDEPPAGAQRRCRDIADMPCLRA